MTLDSLMTSLRLLHMHKRLATRCNETSPSELADIVVIMC